jgi:hypothetical protein
MAIAHALVEDQVLKECPCVNVICIC